MQVLDVAIALLERKAHLESAAMQSQADSAPSEADIKLDDQVRRVHYPVVPLPDSSQSGL